MKNALKIFAIAGSAISLTLLALLAILFTPEPNLSIQSMIQIGARAGDSLPISLLPSDIDIRWTIWTLPWLWKWTTFLVYSVAWGVISLYPWHKCTVKVGGNKSDKTTLELVELTSSSQLGKNSSSTRDEPSPRTNEASIIIPPSPSEAVKAHKSMKPCLLKHCRK